jgi:hypothetical protein
VLAATACTPSLPHTEPGAVVTAVFDPLAAKIPLPNDLVFNPLSSLNSVCPPPDNLLPVGSTPACAQAELLASFHGAFPSDQEVAVTIDFTSTTVAPGGALMQTAPQLDLTSFTPSTLFVYGFTASGQGEVALDPITAADYVPFADHGTLTLHHRGRAPWPEGKYAVFVRGGDLGIRAAGNAPVGASQVFALIAQGQDMTLPQNLGLLRAQTGSTEKALALGQQLNLIINQYKDLVYPVADTRFPHQELAILTTFTIAPAVTNVTIDPARGLVPLPIDLLRDSAKGTLTPLAACTLAGSKLAADGTCASPAAAGFLALDGFSTTGAILAPTSELVQASTVTASSLRLYDLSDPAHPAQVSAADLILEPCEFTSSCSSPTALSPVIAIQPAGATAGDPPGTIPSVFRTKPLKDSTSYAVVMTTAIHDKAGKSIGPGTVAKVLRFSHALSIAGKSQLLGIDDATAAALEAMRLQLQPVFATLAAGGVPSGEVAMAYTFRTQTILKQAAQLADGPYNAPAITAFPITAATPTATVAAGFAKYGVDASVVPGTQAGDHIDEILETDILTFNALDPASGAFLPDPTKAAPESIHVLIATPKSDNPNLAPCAAPLGSLKCAPLMVFRHGLGRGRADMLTVADSFAQAGMVTVAIDAAKHGDRSFCTSGTTGALSGCNGGAPCTTGLPAGAQGDVHPPGTCGAAGLFKRPVSPTCIGACATDASDGIPAVSSNYLVTANFFRTRDTLRQDIIDQAQLIRVLAFNAPAASGTGHTVFDHMAGQGVVIDPNAVYFSGQSLGAIQGAVDVAALPKISKAGFNVGGGTLVDIFTTSPAFAAATNQLLAGLGIQPGTSAFLQFLVVAKTVLDPADPINYAGHLTKAPLANLTPALQGNPNGSVLQAPKKILTQIANCDQVVPNAFNLLYASNVPTGPLPSGPSFFAPGATGTFQLFVTTPFDPAGFGTCTASTVEHGFLTDWVTPSLTSNAQRDLASFVMSNTLPLSVQHQ